MKKAKTNKLNSKGFGHIETIVTILVVASIIVIGLVVYSHSSKGTAHASSYMPIGFAYGVEVAACKTYVPAYGGVYNVTLNFSKLAGTANYYYYFANYSPLRNPHWGIPTMNNSYYAGVIASYKTSAALVTGDQISINLTNASQQNQLGGASKMTYVLGMSSYNPSAGYFRWSDIWNC